MNNYWQFWLYTQVCHAWCYRQTNRFMLIQSTMVFTSSTQKDWGRRKQMTQQSVAMMQKKAQRITNQACIWLIWIINGTLQKVFIETRGVVMRLNFSGHVMTENCPCAHMLLPIIHPNHVSAKRSSAHIQDYKTLISSKDLTQLRIHRLSPH